MKRSELIEELRKMRDVFPKLSTKEPVIAFWYELARHYSPAQWRRGFGKYVMTSDRAPGIASMKEQLDHLFGVIKTEHKQDKYYAMPYDKIEFAMDMLGPSDVTKELRSLSKDLKEAKSGTEFSKLAQSRAWIADYKLKRENMFQLSLSMWEEGQRPKKRFLRDEIFERDWDLLGERLEFNEKDLCINPIDYSGSFYDELRSRKGVFQEAYIAASNLPSIEQQNIF